MLNLENAKVSEIVTENYKAADVFHKYGIDFCCGGGVSLDKACDKLGLDKEEVKTELMNVLSDKLTDVDYSELPLDKLASHIEFVHHTYVRESIPMLLEYLQKVADVHGENHPEMITVNEMFQTATVELGKHMRKEETILFPYVKLLEDLERNGASISELPNEPSIGQPIETMEQEHANEGLRFRDMAKLTNEFTPPADACNTYRVALAKLEEFEKDLHKHIHLENNILFPKALELEKKYFG